MTIDSRIQIQCVNGLFNPATLIKLRNHFIACEDQHCQLENLSKRELSAINRGELPDTMRMQDIWYDVWRSTLSYPAIVKLLSPYSWVTYPVQVRHVQKRDQAVPWHQDRDYMKLLGPRGHEQIITCFIPLELEPAKCTTLQFAMDNKVAPETTYEHVPLDGFGAGIPADQFKDRKHFDLELGDALVFADLTLHRTYTPPGCSVERRSLEFRLIQPEHALPNKDYFDLNTLTFIKTDAQRSVVNHG